MVSDDPERHDDAEQRRAFVGLRLPDKPAVFPNR
jgi:hypothetical protein